jgi:hypothetical protein
MSELAGDFCFALGMVSLRQILPILLVELKAVSIKNVRKMA